MKKLFTHIFSIANLYNSASSNAVIPIRIYSILMSIVFHHYKTLKEQIVFNKNYPPTTGFKKDFNNIDRNKNNNTILKREIEKWNNYSSVLRKPNRILFEEMIQMSYKYSNSINAKSDQYSTESLLLTLVFEQNRLINKNRNELSKNPRNQSLLLFV